MRPPQDCLKLILPLGPVHEAFLSFDHELQTPTCGRQFECMSVCLCVRVGVCVREPMRMRVCLTVCMRDPT